MTPSLIETLRAEIARFLPDAFRTALNNYQEITNHPLEEEEDTMPETASAKPAKKKPSYFKRMAEREDAARKCLAHLQLLLKFAAFLNLPDPAIADNSQIVLSALMQEAEEELQRYHEK